MELLNNESLKNQMKAQIKTMLEGKGVPFEKIEQVFENIYNSSAIQTLNSENIITGRGARGLSKKGHAYINIKECVDKFITTFNTNIAAAVDKMNASDKDFDVIDMDMSVLGTDENGNKIETVNNDDILKSYQTGQPLKTRKHGADYYVKIAEQVIDGLKAQMMAKAKNMCKANGVEFDLSKFNAMFNNAKGLAVNASVYGVDSDGKSFGGVAASSVGGTAVGAGAMATAGYVSAVAAAGSAYAQGTIATVTVAKVVSAATGPVGWVVGGVVAAAAALGFIGFGHHSESYLDTRTLIDGFTQQFSASFSEWVEGEKANAKK